MSSSGVKRKGFTGEQNLVTTPSDPLSPHHHHLFPILEKKIPPTTVPDVGKILPLVSGWAFEARGHNCGSRCAMGGKCNFHNVQDTCISSKRPPPVKELIARTCGSRATLRRFRVLPELPCHVTASLSTQQVHAAHNRCRLLSRYNRQPSRTHLLGSSQKVAS